MLGYQGLSVESMISTPDGVEQDDILVSLPSDLVSMDGDSGKFSGNWIAFFEPRHVKQLRLLLHSELMTSGIQLRNLDCSQRKYSNSGFFVTDPITAPSGRALFSASSSTVNNLTSLSHQISYDGNCFTAIAPGDILSVGSQFWYKAAFNRLDANFASAAVPLAQPGAAPAASPNYTVSSAQTVDLGGGIVSRAIVFSAWSAAADLGEIPLAGTAILYTGNNPHARFLVYPLRRRGVAGRRVRSRDPEIPGFLLRESRHSRPAAVLYSLFVPGGVHGHLTLPTVKKSSPRPRSTMSVEAAPDPGSPR